MSKFILGLMVGLVFRPVIDTLIKGAWIRATRWWSDRKRARYERNQRHKGLAIRKHHGH